MNTHSKPTFFFSKPKIYFAISIGLIISGFLLYSELKTTGVYNIASQLNWSIKTFIFLFVAILMMVIRDFAYMVRIKLLSDQQLSWKQALKVILLWEFASTLTPGVVGGSAVAMFILNKERIPLAKSTSMVIITALFDNLFYIIYVPILLYYINPSDLFPEQMSNIGFDVFWLGYGIILLIAILLSISIFIYPQFFKVILNIIFKIPFLKKFKLKADKFGNELYMASNQFKGKTLIFWFKIFFATTLSWSARFLVVNFIIMAFITLNLTDHLIILGRQLIMWLALLITPTPGGSGMAEFLFDTFLKDFMPFSALSVILAILWRLISYYSYIIIGLLIFPGWVKQKN